MMCCFQIISKEWPGKIERDRPVGLSRSYPCMGRAVNMNLNFDRSRKKGFGATGEALLLDRQSVEGNGQHLGSNIILEGIRSQTVGRTGCELTAQ